ncbi:MAG: MASE3 domain-containing protein [Actinomycetota bacterium]
MQGEDGNGDSPSHRVDWAFAAGGVAAVAGLFYELSDHTFVVFHTLAEGFAILVAFSAFLIAWFSRRWIGPGPLLMLGVGHLFVALADVAHTVAYKGLPIFPRAGPNLSSQLWLVGRFIEATAFLVALSPLARRLPMRAVWLGFAVITLGLISAVAAGWFPTCFVDGRGLTPFKIGSEYVLSGMFLATLALLHLQAPRFDRRVFRLLALAVLAKAIDELLFTLYADAFDAANYVGHIAKVASYVFFLRAVVENGLVRPQTMIFGSVRRERMLTEQLERQAAMMDAVLGASADGVVLVGGDGRLLFVSRAAETLFGIGSERLGSWHDGRLGEVAAAALADACAHVLATGQEDTVEFKGGGRWIECRLSPVTKGGRPASVAVVGRDITVRKAMEEDLQASLDENRALLVEVHHRVRNNLHIVFSMLQMQGWRMSDSRLRHHFDEAGGRILALAKVHEMACQQDSVADVEFARYVRAMCDDLMRMYGVAHDWMAVEIDADRIPLAMDKAVPLGLVVHELASNAIKHAFDRPGGRLGITLHIGEGLVELIVADNGRGFDPAAAEGGLGMRMVEALVQQLRGTVAFDGAGGTTVVVRFPLDTPVEVRPAPAAACAR